ncbi:MULTISPECIES: DNA-methyltransferase [unclassified Acinetobacter]|uniref:DNA-methyltransferase n=1 Tax=unclassified Acinetobacter TaxID=196816 RepID=UPI001909FA6A|nr:MULTISPECIES: site-specific DNA-methyltransferase [unclassified Acinetobacter]MBK0062396.1 site-specific DNA-methyltransferase [Acinetobacter sp. S55]MBK0066200.1 site-specific DNA-methyltransferase [Acinetobacter sp. S54]
MLLDKQINLYKTDCINLLKQLPDQSVHAIVTDPPYFKVKEDAWDRQWKNEDTFFSWLDKIVYELARVLRRDGSLYLFCSSHLQHRTEAVICKHFKVLNHILWVKKGGKHLGCNPPSLRRYFPQTESIIFAEHRNAIKPDQYVCEAVLLYLQQQWQAAGFKYRDAESVAGSAARHYFSRSQWHMPTRAKYELMQKYVGTSYLQRSYDELLKLKHDDQKPPSKTGLRCFTPPTKSDLIHRPHTNIWTFAPVQFYPGKHPCEKPERMLEHIILTSTKEQDLVLDIFAGSCSTAKVCLKLNRRFVGCDLDDRYFSTLEQ